MQTFSLKTLVFLALLFSFKPAFAETVEYFSNNVSTPVSVDTSTPANSTPFPMMVFDSLGNRIDPATSGNQTTANGYLSNIQTYTGNVSSDLANIIGTVGSSVPADATLMSGKDPSANLHAVAVDGNGYLQVNIQASPTLGVNVSEWGGAATALGQTTMSASVPVAIASDQSTLPVSAASLPLPTGAATAANQVTGNTSLSNIDASTSATSTNLGTQADTPATSDSGTFSLIALFKRSLQDWTTYLSRFPASLGQTTMVGSLPVTIASDQSELATAPHINANGSYAEITNLTTTAQSFTPPANAVGFVIEALSDNTANVRYKIGAAASTTSGMRLEPGRSETYSNLASTVSVIAESGTNQVVDIQWIVK
jgi:hypothetical protein